MQEILHSQIFENTNPNAPKLIILHGYLGMSDNWKTLAIQFSEKFEVHTLDLRNHGKSFQTDDFSYPLMVDDVYRYCVEKNINTFHIIGHSMGGKVAMFFGTQYPEMVDKLIIADIGPKYYPPHHQTIMSALNAVDFSTKPSRADVETTVATYIKDFGTRQFLLKNLYWQSPGQLAFRFNLNSFNQNISIIGEALAKSQIYNKPTLFIRGGNSDYILDTDLDTIKEQFPQSSIKTIPDVGHWLHAENPKLFYEFCIDYLFKLDY